MSAESEERSYGRLTAPRLTAELSERSLLCLPVGSLEQHGPHLPLNTDTVIAERFATYLAAEAVDRHNLWVVPPVPYGLSPEHAWSPGTITLDVPLYTALIDALVGEYARSTPVRALLIVNGHGGNSGALEALAHQLQRAHSIATCVVNPSSLAASQRRSDGELPEVHAGIRETSLMLALAADHVRLDLFPNGSFPDPGQREEFQRIALGRSITWPWSSDDPAISSHGVIGGDPRQATAAHGQALLATALHACVGVLDRLVALIAHEPSDLRRTHAPHY
ncbi:creatininase family protein [Streptomonospora salina]|uniref:Creatinine amidohydrolase n=1 Tax=Streptomonospora salina TaxID=104205 RepID=A0A841EHI6_9ACTN|nr:creatininase family protein [Streptomonospora salina]MBB5999840.1 creatinine amidohydrolase [Streptomonospora salina]